MKVERVETKGKTCRDENNYGGQDGHTMRPDQRRKISNLEIDRVLNIFNVRAYKANITCNLPQHISAIKKATASQNGKTAPLLIPIFARSHWMAGILTREEMPVLRIYDSAPSPAVHRDVHRMWHSLWPELAICHETCPRQQRGSEDCGIFTLATLLATAKGITINHTATTAASLRGLFNNLHTLPASEREEQLRRILTDSTRQTQILRGGSADAPEMRERAPDMRARMAHSAAATTIWKRACALDRAAADQNLCHLLAASALEALAAGRPWRTTVKNCETRARRTGLRITSKCPDGRPRFEMQALADTIDAPIHFWGDMAPATIQDANEGSSREPTWSLSGPVTTTKAGRFVVVTAPDEQMQTHLPDRMEVYDGAGNKHTAVFLLGSLFAGRWAPPQGGKNPQIGLAGAQNGHYALTLVPSRATVAVYALEDWNSNDKDATNITNNIIEEDDDVIILTEPPHRATELAASKFIQLLKQASVGDRITMTWQPRATQPAPLDPNKNITWTGTVEATWHTNYHTISVLWDAGQQALGKRRRRVLPEAVLPDPTTVYIDIAIVTPSTPKQQAVRPRTQSQGTEEISGTEVHPGPSTTVTTKRGIRIILPKTAQGTAKSRATAGESSDTAERTAPTHPKDVMSEPTLRMHPKAKGRLNPGDRVCPRAWYIFPDRPPHVSRLAWEATSYGVRQQHIKWLREIRSMPADLLDMELPQAILELVRRRALANKWKWATIERQLATAKSALANITLYTNVGNPILIDTDPEWRQAKRGAARFKSETPPEPPPPITIAHYNEAKALLRADPKAQLLLSMLWAFAARAGDICSLKPQNINIGKPTREGLMRIALTVRKGKGAAFRGPYPIPSTMTRADTQELQRWMAQTDATHRIFRETTQLKARVKNALKKVLPRAALPSIRKGAARHLATTGMAEEDLMQLLGHTRLETTRQYLGYGEHLTVNQRRAQLQTGALQSCGHPPTSGEETDTDSESESQ